MQHEHKHGENCNHDHGHGNEVEKEKNPKFLEYLDKNLKDFSYLQKENKIMRFDDFIEFYKISLIWNKLLFADRKAQFLKNRRTLMRDEDLQAYKMMCMEQQNEDAECLQGIIDTMLERVGLSEQEFQKCLMHHF